MCAVELPGSGAPVIDTSGYKPADVAASAGAIDAHYVFVSSCNAYPGWPAEVVDEASPDWGGGGPSEYGPDKVRCERVAAAALPGRVTGCAVRSPFAGMATRIARACRAYRASTST